MSNEKIDISKPTNNLLDLIRREYKLEPISISPAKRGYYGETWKIITSENRYFAKLVYSIAHKNIFERSFPIVDYLNKSGISFISKIVRTADGRLYTHFGDAVLGIFDWIDGENIEDKCNIVSAYTMLAKIYKIPAYGVLIPREDFSGNSADVFFRQWSVLDDNRICMIFEKYRALLENKSNRLNYFACRCRNDTNGFYITHGDAPGNIITNGNNLFIVDWDHPILAPPERDAWFCLRDGTIEAFHSALMQNGIDYRLRSERLGYYGCYSFFFYLTEYLENYFENRNTSKLVDQLDVYFDKWIEAEFSCANMNSC